MLEIRWKLSKSTLKSQRKKHYFWWLYCRNILKEMYGVEALWGCFFGGRRLTRERRTNARKDGLRRPHLLRLSNGKWTRHLPLNIQALISIEICKAIKWSNLVSGFKFCGFFVIESKRGCLILVEIDWIGCAIFK